jgi:hypothetical protein
LVDCDDDSGDNTIELAIKAGFTRQYAWQVLRHLQAKGYVEADKSPSPSPAGIEPLIWSLTEMGEDLKTFLLDWGLK